MAILNTFSGGGGLIRIPLEAPTDLSLVGTDGAVLVTWTDPVDKVATPGGEMVAEWNYSVLVRNTERVPVSPGDGVEIVRTQTRNQYQTTQYTDDFYIENNVTYYYAVFAVTTIGTVSESASGSATPDAATPVYKQDMLITYPFVYEASTSASQNHVIITGGHSELNNGNYATYARTIDTSLAEGTAANVNGTGGPKTTGTLNGYAFFVCQPESSGITVYSPSLARSLASVSQEGPGVGVGITDNYAVILGSAVEYDPQWGKDGLYCCAFNTSLTKTQLPNFANAIGAQKSAKAGSYAIFSGGHEYDFGYYRPASVLAYDDSLTKYEVLPRNSSGVYKACGAASAGGYAMFAGGSNDQYTYSSASNTVLAFNASLTKVPTTGLREAKACVVGLTMGNYAVFAGGVTASNRDSLTVDYYDELLVRTAMPNVPDDTQLRSPNNAQDSSASSNGLSTMSGFNSKYGIIFGTMDRNGSTNVRNALVYELV